MRRECRERFPRHRLQRKPLVSDPGMHHGTCVPHGLWCIPGSLTPSGGENVPDIPGACATRNFTYLARGPWSVQPPTRTKCQWFFLKIFLFSLAMSRDHFVHAPSQWETMLHCNVVSHWLGSHKKWSLDEIYFLCSFTVATEILRTRQELNNLNSNITNHYRLEKMWSI